MPSHESIRDAKAVFVEAVKEGVTALITQCGYSRDRATSALLRELTRGKAIKPSDDEVFQVMRKYGLGIEEASKVLTVTYALTQVDPNRSPAAAIRLLASKISLRHLMNESSDEDPSNDDESVIRPELRVEPVSTTERLNRAKPASVRKTKPASKSVRAKAKTPSKTIPGRKRTIDEILPIEKMDLTNVPSRDRADSIASQVDAKIAQKSNEENTGLEVTSRASNTARAKRMHRNDESDQVTSSGVHKRNRGSES